jgi:uncharacterized protein YgbK (DUF1537 family)
MIERDLLAAYPAERPLTAAESAILEEGSETVFVVLDDDPTGTQSVRDLPVLTSWEVDDFGWAFERGARAVYVLTNTRSLDPALAAARNAEVVRNALAAAEAAEDSPRLAFVSRSDSTLRGHFPLETDVIAESLVEDTGVAVDGIVIVPAFPDAGRITVGGVHYVRAGSEVVEVAQTDYARDATFGYTHSDLAEWVEEKSAGRYAAADVVRLDLGVLRRGPEAVTDLLSGVSGGAPVVVDAVTEDDLRILSAGLVQAEALGKVFLYRVGPPFVRARIGQTTAGPLSDAELETLAPNSGGGLIVVGSHVELTTRQLARLRDARPDLTALELDATTGDDDLAGYAAATAARVADALTHGDVVLFTSRLLVRGRDADDSLRLARRVSDLVVGVVHQATAITTPRFVVAKGGITSSDVAKNALRIRHALVRGSLLPGLVSLWEPTDGPARGVPFVVFAGNVGDDDALAAVVERLSAWRPHERTSTGSR